MEGSSEAGDRRERADEVRRMFTHGYDSYMLHAYPKDELCPLTCTGTAISQQLIIKLGYPIPSYLAHALPYCYGFE